MNALSKLVLIVVVATTLGCSKSNDPTLSPLAQHAVILALGDSLTSGVGASKDKSYPTVLSTLIDRTVINAGISGDVSAEGLARLPSLLTQHTPDLVIVCLGGNDMLRKLPLDQTIANLTRIIELAQEADAEVVLVGVPKPSLLLSTADFYDTLAEDMKVVYEPDILDTILSDRNLRSDNIHPNSKGYQRFAERLAELIKERGGLE